MPAIDPYQLLRALSPLLESDGSISRPNMAKLGDLMKKYSKKMVSKCIYINIMSVTSSDILESYLNESAWDTIRTWLFEAIDTKNYNFMVEMLQLYFDIPMTLARLKYNDTPKIVNKLVKCEDQLVQILASNVVEKWRNVAKTEAPLQSSLTAVKQEQVEAANKEENHKVARVPCYMPQSSTVRKHEVKILTLPPGAVRHNPVSLPILYPKVNHVKDLARIATEKTSLRALKRKRKQEEELQIEKQSKNLVKQAMADNADRLKKVEQQKKTPISQLPKIPKLNRDGGKKGGDIAVGAEELEDVQMPDYLNPNIVPVKKKVKTTSAVVTPVAVPEKKSRTVKTLPTKFRSTGLEEGSAVPTPKSKTSSSDGGSTSKSNSSASAPITFEKSLLSKTYSSAKRPLSSSKEHKPKDGELDEKKTKVDGTNSTTNGAVKKSGGIQLIPPKPKPAVHSLQLSGGFMDALSESVDLKPVKRKRKSSESLKSGGKDTKQSSKSSVSSPTATISPRLQFYKDTLEGDQPSTGQLGNSYKTALDSAVIVNPEDLKFDMGNNSPSSTTLSDQSTSVSSKPKKKVRWVEDKDLTETFYFEMDENERENVSVPKTFGDMKAMERLGEKEAMSRKFLGDVMDEQIQWTTLLLVDIDPNSNTPKVDYGKDSREKEVQRLREQNILQALYFNKEMIPDSPAEPDLDINDTEQTECKNMPLEDETNPETGLTDFSNQDMPSPVVLPPALSDLMNSIGSCGNNNGPGVMAPFPMMPGMMAPSGPMPPWGPGMPGIPPPHLFPNPDGSWPMMPPPGMPPMMNGMPPPWINPNMMGGPRPNNFNRGGLPENWNNRGGGRGYNNRINNYTNNRDDRMNGNNNNRSRDVCRNFTKGLCKLGRNCRYIHPGQDNSNGRR